MANEQNLRVPTTEEAREIGRKGGIASGEARRAKRDFREAMLDALSELVDRRNDKGDVVAKITAQQAICLKQIAKALKGDTTAAKFCVEVSAEKQKQQNLGGFRFVIESGDDKL